MPVKPLRRSDAALPKAGVVHLGIGAFFRAFGAVWLDEAMAVSGGDWGVIGVSLRSPAQRDLLAGQDFCYHTVEMRPEGQVARRIETVQNVLVAPESPSAVLDVMAAPTTRIVSLTVTEKGYCHEPATGRLNFAHPDIVHDLAHPDAPRAAVGFLAHALALRHKAGIRPFTVLCCDNLPGNGALLRSLVLDFAAEIDSSLADWIKDEARFPSTMVDRIVPASNPGDVETVAQLTGLADAASVMHEPFRQWVIEDHFVDDDRPDFASVGAQMVADVEPFELMKLRCLNGTHSTLAYTGYLAGHETIADAVADSVYAGFLQRLWAKEIIPAVAAPPGVDLAAYCDALLDRYANPAIRHRTWQIAMDGSQKLPQRILGTLADNLAAGRSIDGLSTTVAAWIIYVAGKDESGREIDVQDPLADELHKLATGPDPVTDVLSLRAVFPEALATDASFRAAVSTAYDAIQRDGARPTLARTLT